MFGPPTGTWRVSCNPTLGLPTVCIPLPTSHSPLPTLSFKLASTWKANVTTLYAANRPYRGQPGGPQTLTAQQGQFAAVNGVSPADRLMKECDASQLTVKYSKRLSITEILVYLIKHSSHL